MILFTYIHLNFKDCCQCPRHFDFMFQQLLLEQLLQQWLLEQLLPTKVIGTRKNHETNVCSNNHCWNSCSNNDCWNGRSNKGCWNKDQPRNKFLFQQSLLKRYGNDCSNNDCWKSLPRELKGKAYWENKFWIQNENWTPCKTQNKCKKLSFIPKIFWQKNLVPSYSCVGCVCRWWCRKNLFLAVRQKVLADMSDSITGICVKQV